MLAAVGRETFMFRILLALVALVGLFVPSTLRADAFDNYTNPILRKVPDDKSALRLEKVTPAQLNEHGGLLPGTTGAFLVVRTNERRMSRLLVQPARQKLVAGGSVPILLVDRFVTYREGEERTIYAQGQNLRLFDGFQLSLDLGQIVPDNVGGDVRFVISGDKTFVEAIGKAELYLLTKEIPEATPKKAAKLVVGAAFEPRYFNGVYHLYDDGRRSGKLHLKVADNGDVSGHFYSDKDGRKYEVEGKVGNPNHSLRFHITFPRTIQEFQGWLFTGDGRALTGFARLEQRETGFYALRAED
jgi:hypothetical protein